MCIVYVQLCGDKIYLDCKVAKKPSMDGYYEHPFEMEWRQMRPSFFHFSSVLGAF